MPDHDHTYARITQPFGDGNYDFQFGWDAAIEWEEKYNRSLFGTFNRMHRDGIYLVADIKEIVRLALIGAGSKPTDALRLVERYVEKRPLSENMTLALMILEAAFFGPDAPAAEVAANGE